MKINYKAAVMVVQDYYNVTILKYLKVMVDVEAGCMRNEMVREVGSFKETRAVNGD